jgi:PII-like signaling protein
MEYTEARKLTVYICDDDKLGRKPLSQCVVKVLLEEGILGASVLHGTEGYGSDKQIHTARILDLSGHLPVLVVAVDLKEKIEDVVPKDNEMVEGHGLVTVEGVKIVSPVPSLAG